MTKVTKVMKALKPAKHDESVTVVKTPSTYYVISHKEFIDSYELEINNFTESIRPKFNDSFTKYYSGTYRAHDKSLLRAERNRWYHLIESSNFKPEFDSRFGVRFFADQVVPFQEHTENLEKRYSYKDIEALASKHIRDAFESNSYEQAEKLKLSILKACEQISRYLPEFEQKKPRYFIDGYSSKIGVTFQESGTLTLLIGATSEVEFTYAQKLDSGTTRITGVAKLTKHLKNSKNIWKLLGLQGVME